jgi:hypothetical protein
MQRHRRLALAEGERVKAAQPVDRFGQLADRVSEHLAPSLFKGMARGEVLPLTLVEHTFDVQ